MLCYVKKKKKGKDMSKNTAYTLLNHGGENN